MAVAQSPSLVVDVYAKRRAWDRERWVFSQWVNDPPSHTSIDANPQLNVRENVRTFVTREQFDALDAAFTKRKQADDDARQKIEHFEYAERDAIRRQRGWSEQDLARLPKPPAGWKEPSSDEKAAALRDYFQSQEQAEKIWVREIDEILPPDLYSRLAAFFVRTGNGYLATELFASHLQYDAAQRRRIEALCSTYQKDIEKFKGKVAALQKGETLNPADVEWIKSSLYRPYTALTIDQFENVAVISGLKGKDESWVQFRDRVGADSQAGKMLLCPIIDKLIESK